MNFTTHGLIIHLYFLSDFFSQMLFLNMGPTILLLGKIKKTNLQQVNNVQENMLDHVSF